MASQYTHDIVANVGEYTDRRTGEKKKQTLNCGKIFTNEYGHQSFKLTCIPVGPEWSGWFNIYERRTDDRPPPPRQAQAPPLDRHAPRGMPPAPPEPATNYHDDEEIPF